MSLILDISSLSCGHTDEALEFLHKSISDGDGGSEWDEHPSPLIRRLIELFTERGLTRLEIVQKELEAYAKGIFQTAGKRPPRPPGTMERWTPDELKLSRLYLERLPPAQWTLDDHMMLVDYLVQRYLPADEMKTEAEWLATRSTLMGRVQANMDIKEKEAEKIAAALPSAVAIAEKKFTFSPAQRETLNYAVVHAGENVRAFTEDARHSLRMIVVKHAHDRTLGETKGQSLQSELHDRFSILNRDWRRIAITESGNALGEGLVASVKPGTQLKRVEQYRGACPFCRRIDGKIVTVVAPDASNKDPDTMIWSGKNNIGRSASPRKRVGDQLVERSAEEMWQVPAGLAHPSCRGRWIQTIELKEGDDPDFHKWMIETLNQKK